jgi:hypothetical protein
MRRTFGFLFVCAALVCLLGCPLDGEKSQPQTNAGVKQVNVTSDIVKTDSAGRTAEQRNIIDQLTDDNRPGSIKHLYVVSVYSGDVLLYSPVDGKVTSSSKRLKPYTVVASDGQHVDREFGGVRVMVNGRWRRTTEVIQDDGTYGSSIPYLHWKTPQGIRHKHYVSGGQMVHVSNQPMRVGKVVLNLAVEGGSVGGGESEKSGESE